MHVFLYEWITGGGLVEASSALPPTMLAEGSAMISALAADFAAIEGARVSILRDARLDRFPQANVEVVEVHSMADWTAEFNRLAAAADYSLVVAPEFDGNLRRTVGRVREVGGRALNADDEFIAVASDKHETATRLHAAGVPAPVGRVLEADEEKLPGDFCYPAVLKPVDGAGSQHLLQVEGPLDEPPAHSWRRRLEAYCEGRAASVALICGLAGHVPLPPCWQHLSADSRFTYRGGAVIREKALAQRATALGQRAVGALPGAHGYVGVDLVLGDSPHGDDDVVIEINPRLTTSYVGLRAAVHENLSQAMVDAACGRRVELTQREQSVAFSADGRVWTDGR